MRRDEDMRPGVPEGQVGSNWDSASRRPLSPEQTAFNWAAQKQLENDQVLLRSMFGAMVRAFGGVDALTAALDREPSYASKIVESMHGQKDRKVQLEWLAPMLRDPRSAELMLAALAETCGFAAPVRERRVTQEQEAAAAREVIREMPEPLRSAYRQEMARKLGVRVDDLGL